MLFCARCFRSASVHGCAFVSLCGAAPTLCGHFAAGCLHTHARPSSSGSAAGQRSPRALAHCMRDTHPTLVRWGVPVAARARATARCAHAFARVTERAACSSVHGDTCVCDAARSRTSQHRQPTCTRRCLQQHARQQRPGCTQASKLTPHHCQCCGHAREGPCVYSMRCWCVRFGASHTPLAQLSCWLHV
jgi:hypothetical protein